jgi:hypothetical protein
MYFYNKNAAFNLRWCEVAERRIDSYIKDESGTLTKPGMDNNVGDHSSTYSELADLLGTKSD